MSSSKYTSYDELMKKSLEQRVKSFEDDIDIEKAWSQFEQKYVIKKNRPTKIIAVCSILLLFVTSIAILPTESGALSNKFFQVIKSMVTGNVENTYIVFSSDDNLVEDEAKSLEKRLEPEIINQLKSAPFNVLLPVNMIGKYKINKIEVEEDIYSVTIFMEGPNAESVIINEKQIFDGFSMGISYDKDDSVMKNVKLQGLDAVLINNKNKNMALFYVDRDIKIDILAGVSEDEVLDLGLAMRRINWEK